MPLKVNVRLLQRESAQLEGELPQDEAVAGVSDELVRLAGPVHYDLQVARQGQELRVIGTLEMEVECDCSRCLKTFRQTVTVPDVALLVPLEGEDAVALDGDFADLTPFLREDTLLALPTNPLCTPDCRGLAANAPARDSRLGEEEKPGPGSGSNPWDALDKLNL